MPPMTIALTLQLRNLRRVETALGAALLAIGLVASSASAAEGVGIPAQVVDIEPETEIQEHPTTDLGSTEAADDDRQGTTRWRVVKDTGNCCENHLAISSDGRLFDVGGSFVNFTDDRGETWRSVRPLEPLVNGEGSIVVAPNGDILGIEWDPYSGDHLVAFKYNATSREWFYMENLLHHPFYDRPWISVVPGPFAIGLGADTVPYITFVQGGFPLKDPMFISTDGLTYLEASSLIVDGATDTPVDEWFPIQADASFDWIQPIRRSPVTPLGAGRALGAGGWLLDPEDRTWDSWRLPDGSLPPTFIQIDSAGRIHHVRSVAGGRLEYRVSVDGARTWNSEVFDLALGGLTDFKVNLATGVGAISTRVGNQDWVYKFDVTGNGAKLARVYRVGLGDETAFVGLQVPPQPRYDFKSINIFPDGRVATSFFDSTTFSHPPGSGTLGTITPAVAIELETEFGDVLITGLDDSDPAIEYRRGWHRRSDSQASQGGYHRRLGSPGGGEPPTARLVFEGDEIRYFFAVSEQGGTADVFLDGEIEATVDYSGPAPGNSPEFGQSISFDELGDGSHELVIAHRSGAVYVDGFEIVSGEDGGADPSAARTQSVTMTSTGELPGLGSMALAETVEVGPDDEWLSVVVEGAREPLTVKLLDATLAPVAEAGQLLAGSSTVGLDVAPALAGTYTVQILDTADSPATVEISIARTIVVD